jgi:hypothetical protein
MCGRLIEQLALTFEVLATEATEDELAAERAVAKTTKVRGFNRTAGEWPPALATVPVWRHRPAFCCSTGSRSDQPRTRPQRADLIGETKVSNGLSPAGGRHHFFAAISFSIALSGIPPPRASSVWHSRLQAHYPSSAETAGLSSSNSGGH